MTNLQVSVEALEGLEKRMTVTIPADQIEEEVNLRLVSVGRTAKLKGFRPGKVPQKVIRQHYGAEVREKVLSEMVQSSYEAALDQEKLRPAAMPTLEQGKAETGDDFAYSATFEVYPEFELKGLDTLKIERAETEIGDADIDEMLETLRVQKAIWNPVERKAADGDRVTIDFEGRIKNEPIEGGAGQEVPVIIGQGRMLEEFEKNLVGLSAGDEKTFKLKFPKDYQAEELAGKKATFTVTAREVAEKELPEVGEEFVRGYGVESGDVEEFRVDVRNNMEREALAMIDSDVKRQVMEQLLENNPIAIPTALIRQEADSLRDEALRNLGITEKNADDPRVPPLDAYSEAAERRVRLSLLIRAVIEENELRVDPERVQGKIDEICAPYDKPEEYKKLYLQTPQLLEQIQGMVLEEQVVDWLVSKSELTVTTKTFGELRHG